MPIDAIFFDAGGTLVFPDLRLTLAALYERGVRPAQEQLYAAERTAKRALDEARAHGVAGVDARYWQLYYDALLAELGLPEPPLRDALVQATRIGTNWRSVPSHTRKILQSLHSRFRLGVISNSDGSIARLMEELGLTDCFDSITDSRHCGYEKPDPRIFRAALASLGASAERSLYVGDIYSVDFLGARQAGMQALLMDAAGVYAAASSPSIRSLAQFESWLEGHLAR